MVVAGLTNMGMDDLNRTPFTEGAEQTDQEQNSTGDVSELARALSIGDPARLEQLRTQVASGNYDVSPDELAQSIIDAHLKE